MRYVKTLNGRYQKVTDEQLRAMRYIPKNAIPIEEKGLGVAYVGPYAHKAGYFHVVAYAGTAAKPSFNYIYKSEAEVDRKLADWFQGLREHKERVNARRKESFGGHNFTVGDIVTNSWGYDQTNVDWYCVTKTAKCYVWLRPIQATCEQTGFMCGQESVKLDAHLKPIFTENSKETKHRASGDYVTMQHGSGRKHMGGSQYSSWYA